MASRYDCVCARCTSDRGWNPRPNTRRFAVNAEGVHYRTLVGCARNDLAKHRNELARYKGSLGSAADALCADCNQSLGPIGSGIHARNPCYLVDCPLSSRYIPPWRRLAARVPLTLAASLDDMNQLQMPPPQTNTSAMPRRPYYWNVQSGIGYHHSRLYTPRVPAESTNESESAETSASEQRVTRTSELPTQPSDQTSSRSGFPESSHGSWRDVVPSSSKNLYEITRAGCDEDREELERKQQESPGT